MQWKYISSATTELWYSLAGSSDSVYTLNLNHARAWVESSRRFCHLSSLFTAKQRRQQQNNQRRRHTPTVKSHTYRQQRSRQAHTHTETQRAVRLCCIWGFINVMWCDYDVSRSTFNTRINCMCTQTERKRIYIRANELLPNMLPSRWRAVRTEWVHMTNKKQWLRAGT